jgi:putative FmdB family regulatory protein
MPLYEYRCSACDHLFERIVKFSDPPLKTCPQCGKETVHQVIHAPAVQFKGSGWYVSDYARKSGSGAAASSSQGGEKASGTEGGAKQSAPASGGTTDSSSGGSSATKGDSK